MATAQGVDFEEIFKKFASTYEDIAFPMRDVSRYALSLCPPLTGDSVVLDDGCGTGITTAEILKLDLLNGRPKYYAVDFSAPMVEELRKRGFAGVETAVMDARDLKFPDNMFTHSFLMFVL